MKRHVDARIRSTIAAAFLAIALLVSLAQPAHADKKSEAKEQFTRAVKMRTMLEGYLEKDRSLADYKQTIAAYEQVYLITPQAEEVTPSLVAESELYQEMGRLYGPKYYESAVKTCDFLLKQYPGTRFRADALLAIAQIQKDDLNKPDDAEATFNEFLKRFPLSAKAGDARKALKEITDAREQANVKTVAYPQPPAVNGPLAEPREAGSGTPFVKAVHTWNSANDARIIIAIGDTVKYKSAHIASPDRIYFDLYKARITPGFARKPVDVDSGLLKSVRVAQNQHDAVRIVLDVNGAKDYSAFLVSHPYRLVIDVHSGAPAAAGATPDTATLATKGIPVPAASDLPALAAETVTVKSKPKAALASAALQPPSEPKLTRDGGRSLTRELGLKISRIVIDPGHGGKDTGTIGPHGLMEKDLCLDVALRLGRLIEQKLPGAEVIYTRKDDTFIPLEERTAIADREKADLFISIHANSSHDRAARGIETYYLNLSKSPEALEVATRENAFSQTSVHDLPDLIKQITRNDKIEESQELASDIQDALSARLQLVSRSEKNRGVKKAPFIVLIGANMPSVLSEISFVSNPSDERLLRAAPQRQRIADGLYRGIASYLTSLNSFSYNKQKPTVSDHLDAGTLASNGNQK